MESIIDLPATNDAPLGAFLAQLSQLVIAEAETRREQTQQIWSQPIAARVASGRAIADVNVVGVAAEGLVTLRCPRNDSRFREGDVLCLHRGSPFHEPALLVTLEADEDTELLVSTDDPTLWLADRNGWTLDEGYLDISHLTLDALAQAGDTLAGRQRVLPLLMGQRRSQTDSARYDDAYARAIAWGLNEEQADALANAYACDIAWLIQGPPGTGKTQVLARLAQLLTEQGERVLITAFTHRAIDNALNTLAALAPQHDATPVTAIKIGRAVRLDELRVPNYERYDASPLTDLTGSYVVGATPFATRSQRLGGVEFDTVIFDEASQITLPLAIMGMLSARRFIFVGDHRQLPPVLSTRRADASVLGESVFATLMNQGFDTLLAQTYRFNAELAAWPSAQFYDGRLRPAPPNQARRIAYPRPPARLQHILDAAAPVVFVELSHRGSTTRSDAEASLAVDVIIEMLASGIAPGAIGVVTPYRAQIRAIRGLLRVALPDDRATRQAVVVDTVERMQGQEREAVIVSLTTSHPTYASELASFLFRLERLNVAITRPRSKLIILGSRHLLEAAPEDQDERAWVALLRDLLDHCASRRPIAHT